MKRERERGPSKKNSCKAAFFGVGESDQKAYYLH